jgi:hypothetical protein
MNKKLKNTPQKSNKRSMAKTIIGETKREGQKVTMKSSNLKDS